MAPQPLARHALRPGQTLDEVGVDAEDIVAVAVRTLTGLRAPNTDLVLTGPEALGYDDIATVVAEVTGRPVVIGPCPATSRRPVRRS
ncbi:hypothetical protein [Streptomyces sp. NPDC096033]|uniref:hypothetical protein n=1 Tax=Streptomyces sp. NPDC096033 TaxID=3366071 RepID=UPI0037F3EAF6